MYLFSYLTLNEPEFCWAVLKLSFTAYVKNKLNANFIIFLIGTLEIISSTVFPFKYIYILVSMQIVQSTCVCINVIQTIKYMNKHVILIGGLSRCFNLLEVVGSKHLESCLVVSCLVLQPQNYCKTVQRNKIISFKLHALCL